MAQSRLKTALVTGSARRIGRSIALALAEAGYRVVIHYQSAVDEARATAADIAAAGGEADILAGDLAAIAANGEFSAFWARAESVARGPIGVLVNNASVFEPDHLQDLSPALYNRHLALHVTAPVFLAQALARRLPPGTRGDVVHILDQRVLRPNPLFFSYSLSKSALHAVLPAMAQALAPAVRVNAVAPGPTMRNRRQSDQDFARQQAAILLEEGPWPGEIAAAVVFLVGSESITGQTLAVDGGQHLAWRTPDIEGITE